jgi:hypothetical protein
MLDRVLPTAQLNWLKREDDLAALIALEVATSSDFVADVLELAQVPVIPASVRFLKEVKLSALGFMFFDGPVAANHLHVTGLTLTGV